LSNISPEREDKPRAHSATADNGGVMPKIKICGLSRQCDIEAVNESKPEYIGFVFAPKSRRFITPEKALELRKILNNDIIPVGVFFDEESENVAALVRNGVIDIAQLHGSESEEYISKLKTLVPCPVIKAVVQRENADFFMFDSPGGGTGQIINWKIINNKDIKKPFFLAGGLDAGNVAEAIRLLNPYAVDVSSGVETDGHKDQQKIAEFIRRARNA